jgi:hypothetical protein
MENPYRVLVEKYEALVRVKREGRRRGGTDSKALSLQEELELSGEMGSFNRGEEEDDEEVISHPHLGPPLSFSTINGDLLPRTLSETETSSGKTLHFIINTLQSTGGLVPNTNLSLFTL